MIDKLKSYIIQRSTLQQAKNQTAEALRYAQVLCALGEPVTDYYRIEEAHRLAYKEYDSFEAKHFDLEQCLTELASLLEDYK
jgi:hypothetical protein